MYAFPAGWWGSLYSAEIFKVLNKITKRCKTFVFDSTFCTFLAHFTWYLEALWASRSLPKFKIFGLLKFVCDIKIAVRHHFIITT